MTVKELIETLKGVPENSELDIYDLRNFSHPKFELELSKYFNYDTGVPIVTVELSNED